MTLILRLDNYAALHDFLAEQDLILNPNWFKPKTDIQPPQAIWALYSSFAKKKLSPAEWGMNPNWARKGQIPRQLTVARVESVFERVSYKSLVRRYRAIIPVSGSRVRSLNRDAQGRYQYFDLDYRGGEAFGLGGLYQFNADGNMQVVLLTKALKVPALKKTVRLPIVVGSEEIEDWLTNEKEHYIRDFLDAYAMPELSMTHVMA